MKTRMASVQKWVLIGFIGMLCQSLTPTSISAQGPFIIQLKNGNTITTPIYSEDGDMLYYEKYGTRIGIKRSTIIAIKRQEAEEKSSGSRTADYLGYRPPPKYFEVSGAPVKTYNGIYEQSEDHNGKPSYVHITQQHHLFYQGAPGKKKKSGWALGRLYDHGKTISYVNFVKAKEPPPVTGGKWTTSSGVHDVPSIRIASAKTPNSAYQGAHAYRVKQFPFVEANGVYKPLRIYLGKMRYKHESTGFEMYYQTGWGWCISNCTKKCTIAYRSRHTISRASLPHDVKIWYDIHLRKLYGKVTLEK